MTAIEGKHPCSSARPFSNRVLNVMAFGIVDTMIMEISRVLESVFDFLEYRSAKKASAKMAKQKMKTQSYSPDDLYASRIDKHSANYSVEITE